MNEEYKKAMIDLLINLLNKPNFLVEKIEVERQTFIVSDNPVTMGMDGKMEIRLTGFLNPEK